jgi:hypothetical protein
MSFGGGGSPPPPPPPPPPVMETAPGEADEAARKAREQAARKRGRSKTILTSPTGAPLGETATTGQPRLGA